METDEELAHGYTWADVRDVPASDIGVGTTWVRPAAFSAYLVANDGRVAGCGIGVGMRGTAWTCTAREGDVVTARSHRGAVGVQEIRPGQRVLLVVRQPDRL
ncbi:hypothetical protein [Micromonospora sp. NPDC005652]|uniref:hypothetical protein n=1 Tax=Micromonospora sp. NPDC005652 TaxID=3157046 RepID=UPI003408E599